MRRMNTLLPLGIMSLVLGVLLGALVEFPMVSAQTIEAGDGTASDFTLIKDAEEVGARFSLGYIQVIDDLASFGTDPDYTRAEERRETMADYADSLIPRFENLVDQLTNILTEIFTENGDLAAEYEALLLEYQAIEPTGG